MKRIFPLRNTFVACLCSLSSVLLGDTFTLSSGDSIEGALYKILDGTVTIKNAAGEKPSYPIASFDDASKQAIDAWASENPFSVNVYAKWDTQPKIKSSVMPKLPSPLSSQSGFRGMASVDLLLDTSGRVTQVRVSKSTHPELVDASIEAAMKWKFSPAKVGGSPVKAKLRVPFKFSN